VEAPEGTAARPTMPSSRTTSTSTVGLPRESRTSRAITSRIVPPALPCCTAPCPLRERGRHECSWTITPVCCDGSTPDGRIDRMAQDETGYAIVLTTAGSEEQAEAIARMLVDKRLAACVNVAPQIKSFYRWKGKVVEDEEFLLVIKTEAGL